jgi:DNA-binding LytR/AlgR family response regulator
LKPVPFDRFLKAVNKALEGRLGRAEQSAAVKESHTESFVYFRSDRKMVKVMLTDLLYVESMKDYSKVYTTQGMLITKQSISAVEAMLPEKEFIRVHRSYIVSLQHVRSFTQELIEIGETEIPIGKLYRQMVMKAFGS